MKRATSNLLIAAAVVLVMGFTTLAVAQDRDEIRAIFDSAPKVATSVGGVQIFAGPPKGFNPMTASGRELAQYGLPQRPDQAADPKGFAVWQRGMLALKTRASDVRATKYFSREFMPAKNQPARTIEAGPSTINSTNWSGVAITNTNKSWNNKTSFTYVTSVFNVPAAQPPFGACDNGILGPFYELSWSGIDGFSILFGTSDVLQGGSYSYADCGGNVQYLGWVEWYPSYSFTELMCGGIPCLVNAGDDFWVVTYGLAGTATQSVYVEDITSQWYGTMSLPYVTGPGLVGNTAEWIVERPYCCAENEPLPLANYIYDFFTFSYAEDGADKVFYAGSTASSAFNITMLDDSDTQNISWVDAGTSGEQGKYSLTFGDEGCANSGGCTP